MYPLVKEKLKETEKRISNVKLNEYQCSQCHSAYISFSTMEIYGLPVCVQCWDKHNENETSKIILNEKTITEN